MRHQGTPGSCRLDPESPRPGAGRAGRSRAAVPWRPRRGGVWGASPDLRGAGRRYFGGGWLGGAILGAVIFGVLQRWKMLVSPVALSPPVLTRLYL